MHRAASSAESTTNPREGTGVSRGTSRATRAADLAYSTFYGGAIGGSAVAIFFLILDTVRGQPLYTPSFLGSVLFTGADPASVTPVRVDMVAFYSIVHFVAFFVLGGVTSRLLLATDVLHRNTIALAVVVFALLIGALLVADRLLMPGVVSALGILPVVAANAATAWVMAWFIERALADRMT